MRLEGKVAFISGGARGMGAVEARLFAREGAKISIGDLLEEEGRRVEAEINGAGGNCLFVHLDVTNEANWQRAIAATVDRFGKLDILVNNAGVGSRGRLHETTIEEWNQVMDINATGTFLGTKAAIPEMQKAGAGSIINISSGAGNVGVHFVGPAYHASKAAVRLLAHLCSVRRSFMRPRRCGLPSPADFGSLSSRRQRQWGGAGRRGTRCTGTDFPPPTRRRRRAGESSCASVRSPGFTRSSASETSQLSSSGLPT